MRIAFTSYSGYGSWFLRRLQREKHTLTYFLTNPLVKDVLSGLIPTPKIIKRPDYSNYDLSIFDLTGRARAADTSLEVCPTIGDGSLNCKLEDDRTFGIELMEQAGIAVPPYESFSDSTSAMQYVKKTGKRFVFKPSGGQDQDADTTYVSRDAADMLSYLAKLNPKLANNPFLLQEFIAGTEVSTEGWFDGSEFWLLNFTLEDKKFMNDNRGPNTGCAGNLVGLTGSSSRIYREGLEKAKDVLQQLGYRGMIDLNTIVTEDKAYGLEWTPRFGYDASATLCRMYAGNYGEMLAAIASGVQPDALWGAEYGASVRLSIPPYPTEIPGKHKEDVICSGLDPDRDYLYDIYSSSSKNSIDPTLQTVGVSGFIGAPITIGNDPTKIFDHLYHIVDDVKIPNMQYRTDCDKSALKKLAKLKLQGWI
jgi:phosphoribosylamine---glycine ligase